MSLILLDRVKQTTTTIGTGTITLNGLAVGFQPFSSLGDGATTYYTIQGDADWEVGIGIYSSNTLTRDTVLSSSNGGSLVNFTKGTKNVFVTLPAEKTITSIASANASVTVTQVGTEVNLAVSGGGGSGDVVGPASATDNAVARFDTTTGKLIQNSVTTIDDTGNASGILSQQFSNGSAVTLAAGKFWYDGSTGSWNAGMGGGNITQQVGEELFIYGKASATITDSPLQIIYHTGTVGASGVVTFAPTIAGITNANDIIGIATEPLANNAFGRITTFGLVRGITTNGSAFGETWADDDAIWYNPVTGNPTKVEPVAPYIKMQIGTVITAGSGGSGSFQVGLQRGSTLGGTDSNVQFGTLANNNLIAYDNAAGYWKNVTASSLGLGTVTSVGGTGTVSGLTLSGTVTSSGNLTLGGAITGFAASGANTDITSVTLTSGTVTTTPSTSNDIVNKSYADSIVAGVNFHTACQYATIAALAANTYNNGTSGVGATLTANANGTLTIDGYTLVSGDVGKRLLIKNEATQANNGVYTLTQAGTAGLPYILTRATDYDSSGSGTNEIDSGDFLYVIAGSTLANTSWVQQTPLPITVGTTAIVFIQFAAGGSSYTAGTGLTLSANQFSITNTGTAGTYGSASQIPVFTTNAQGQVTSVTNTPIAVFTPTIDRLTSTQQSTATALADVTQLVEALVANATYSIDCFVTFQSAATTTGLNLGFTSPTGCVCSVEVVVPVTSTAAASQLRTTFPNAAATNTGNVLGTGVTAINSNHTARISGIITNGANAGNFQVRFATEVAASAITLQTSSVMVLERLV